MNLIFLQAQITDFITADKIGIIGLLIGGIYFLHSFFKTQVADLRIEVTDLKAENKELREKILEMQATMIEFMANSPQRIVRKTAIK